MNINNSKCTTSEYFSDYIKKWLRIWRIKKRLRQSEGHWSRPPNQFKELQTKRFSLPPQLMQCLNSSPLTCRLRPLPRFVLGDLNWNQLLFLFFIYCKLIFIYQVFFVRLSVYNTLSRNVQLDSTIASQITMNKLGLSLNNFERERKYNNNFIFTINIEISWW